jgi:hypothetical protein
MVLKFQVKQVMCPTTACRRDILSDGINYGVESAWTMKYLYREGPMGLAADSAGVWNMLIFE